MSDFRHKKILQKKRLYMKDNLVLKGTRVLDQLFQDGVLNHVQFTKMDLETKENEERVSDLLSLLYTRPYEDWEKFLKALSEHNQEHVVKELSVFEGDKPDAAFVLVQRTFARTIRDRYGKVEIWKPQGETECVSVDKIFIDVQLETSNQMLTGYKDICRQFTQASTIHICGEPGTGKSTLSTRLCFDWASQHASGSNTKQTLSSEFENFKFVLPVYLENVKEGHTFLDFVVDSCGLEWEEAEAVCRYIEQNQESTLFVVDGLDEYDNISEDMTKILQRKMYPDVKMLVTSRNTALLDKKCCKCVPDLELTLHGFSDEGVQEYAKMMCHGFVDMMKDFLLYTKRFNYLDYLGHYPAFLLLMINIWQPAFASDQTVPEIVFFLEFIAYVVSQKRQGASRISTDLLIREHHKLIMTLGKLASTSISEDRMDQEFSSEVVLEHIDTDDLKFCLKLGFLLKKQDEDGQYVYKFIHKAIQDMFLSYYIAKSPFEDQGKLALSFCEFQKAFVGSDIARFVSSYRECNIRVTIDALCSGDEERLARIHTEWQLKYLPSVAQLELPVVAEILIKSSIRDLVTKYFSQGGSRLERLTVRSHEQLIYLLKFLTAPNLTSLTLTWSGEGIINEDESCLLMVEPALAQFRLKTLKMYDIGTFSAVTISALVRAACQMETLECLIFTFVPLTIDCLHKLKNWLPRSVLKTLILCHCGLKLEHLLYITDVFPDCSTLETLEISRNYFTNFSMTDVKRLVDQADHFRRLRKLNLSFNMLPGEIKKQIKEKLLRYLELEVEIEKQSEYDEHAGTR